EADWNKPKATDVFYVFAYDWRRDNVESAQQLIAKITAVKRKLRRPSLKFDIIAHSMGGLIARYAAMYGGADLRVGKSPVPTWAGAAHIDKLLMFGTPNQGSFAAFDALLNGMPIVTSMKLPLIDDFRAEDVLTSPSVFQVLPHQSSAHFYDENMKPISVDLYDPDTWFKYGWGALSEPKFLGKLKDAAELAAKNPDIKKIGLPKNPNADDILISQTTYAQAKAYFVAALDRAKRFQDALDAPSSRMPIQMLAYGGNCAPTLDGAILVPNAKKDKWTTIISAKDYKTSTGTDMKKEAVKDLIFPLGDGRVTQTSLLVDAESGNPVILPLRSKFFSCSAHTKLFLDKPIQDSFLSALVVTKQGQP
ncbi:MAG: hypothetical protein JO053_15985, partial [Acidobacteria bacterium]|nr:hypothetical protein [Acidobacteriota bacterium]